MKFSDVLRIYAPANASPSERAPTPAAEPEPESGARWGKASGFSWSNEAAKAGRSRRQTLSVEYPDAEPPEYIRIIDAELKVMAERVKVRDAANPDLWVEIDRVKRMAFHYTEFPPEPNPAALQPSLTTYYDLHFDLHPPASGEAP